MPCPTKVADVENTSHSGGHSGEQTWIKTKSTRICVDQIEINLSIFVYRTAGILDQAGWIEWGHGVAN